MAFTVLALAVGTAIGLASGGRFRYLPDHRIRAWWLLPVGFGLQFATDHLALGRLGTPLVLVGSAALLTFAAHNRHLVGMGIVAIGVAANALVIASNGGMPVRPDAVVAAGIARRSTEPFISYGARHHREGPSDHLDFLADIIPIPALHEVASFGDVILAVGGADVVAHLLRPKRRHLVRTAG